MTGKPMPENAMERMQMAPEVYQFTKNFAKKPNLLEKTGNLAKSIGRGAVMAIGAPMVAESLAAEADRKEMTDVTGDVQPEMSEKMQIEVEKTRREQIKNEGRENLQRMANTGVQQGNLNPIQEKTTADEYNQDILPQQTEEEQGQRSATQQAELETNQTIADNAAASQDFTPKKSVEEIESDLARDMEIAGRTRIGGPANVTEAVDKFLGQSGLDPILLAAMNARGQQEELAGTSFQIASPLGDNPQTPPGQTNSAVSQPFAENIEPITNPSPNPTLTQQLGNIMNTLRKGRADLSESQRMDIARKLTEGSPNEVVGNMQKQIDDLNQSSDKLIGVMNSMRGEPSQEQLIDASQARSRVEQKTAAKQRKSGIQSRMTDKYYPSDVARTDIQVGGMVDRKTGLGKSVGMSYTPLNGDTKVGFNIMGDPTKPQEVSTFDFVASPKTMESLQSQEEGDLGSMTFGKLFNIAKKQKEGFSGMEM
tara:strand:- start:805 stop:2247 length:1443 start_codon:yes stop_codon:yes gene_type:complete